MCAFVSGGVCGWMCGYDISVIYVYMVIYVQSQMHMYVHIQTDMPIYVRVYRFFPRNRQTEGTK